MALTSAAICRQVAADGAPSLEDAYLMVGFAASVNEECTGRRLIHEHAAAATKERDVLRDWARSVRCPAMAAVSPPTVRSVASRLPPNPSSCLVENDDPGPFLQITWPTLRPGHCPD